MSDIFISYARSTAAEAQRIAQALRTLGHAVWYDEDLPAHRAYADVIQEQLQAARAVVVLWSAAAAKSEWVRSEAESARASRKLIQVTIDGARLPMPFDQIECANLVGWTGASEAPGWRKVVASVADLTAANVDLARAPDFRLGDVLFSPSALRMHSGAGDRRVEAKVMEVLVMLVRNAGRTVTRDQLIDACWDGRIVSDDAVNRVVAQVRALSRAVEPAPFTLETVPKVGFRLSHEEASKQEKAGEGAAPARPRIARARVLALAALAGLILVVGGFAAWWKLRPAATAGPIALAVLPFRNLTSGDANLVDAIWDDTRGALSRNPNLRVLGRTTVEALAAQKLDPSAIRSKVGVAYLLDGSVQRIANHVQIDVALTRTADGAEVWSDRIGGELDDVLALQNRIAGEVEGRIRGRIAPNRGIKAENISTTGDVYQIFAEARARIRRRNGDDMQAAAQLLKRAIELDPNYAPAWVELGVATQMRPPDDQMPDQARASAVGDIKRALTLAPNLAHAHAALAMVQNLPPSSEGELRRALALDPGDAEAWMWLGNLMSLQNRIQESLVAHSRAAEIDPLWRTAVTNRIENLVELGKDAEIEGELRRIERAGDPKLLAYARWVVAANREQPAQAARVLLDLGKQFPAEEPVIAPRLASELMELGYIDEAAKLWRVPAFVPPIWRGHPESPEVLQTSPRPVDFWVDREFPMIYARLLPKVGRLHELIGYYHAAFHNPDELAAALDGPGRMLVLAPNLAVDLRQAGEDGEASLMIAKAESILAPLQANGPLHGGGLICLAQLRAAEGRDDEALDFLAQAVGKGWLPDRTFFATDIAEEPAFGRLLARPQFQALRKRILDRIEQERRALGPVSIL